jgi:hypothetical protein
VALGANRQLDLSVLARSGTIVTYGADGSDPHIPVRYLMVANVTLRFLLIYGVPELPSGHEAAEAGAIGKVLIDIDG